MKIAYWVTKPVMFTVAVLLLVWLLIGWKTWYIIEHEQRQSALGDYYSLTNQAYNGLRNSLNLFNILRVMTTKNVDILPEEHLARVQASYNILAHNTWIERLSVFTLAGTNDSPQLTLLWHSNQDDNLVNTLATDSEPSKLQNVMLHTLKNSDWENTHSSYLLIAPFKKDKVDNKGKFSHLNRVLLKSDLSVTAKPKTFKYHYIEVLELSPIIWFERYKIDIPPWLSMNYQPLNEWQQTHPKKFKQIQGMQDFDVEALNKMPNEELNAHKGPGQHKRIALLSNNTLPLIFTTEFDVNKIVITPFNSGLFWLICMSTLLFEFTILFYMYLTLLHKY